MKVLVTGATGFVGQEVVKQLHAAGYAVRILARNTDSPKVAELVSRYGVSVHYGNIFNFESLKGSLDGMNAVIHLVGIITEFRENTFQNVHTLGTDNITTATYQSTVVRFIHMSALGTRPDAASRYHASKWAAEEAVRLSSLDHTIFRPSLIYGPQDNFVNLFARLIRFSPVVPIPAPETAHFQPIHVESVAAAFVRSLTEPHSIEGTYDLCGPEALTLSQMVQQICSVMRRKRLQVRVPPSLAAFQARFLEWLYPRLFRKASPLNRDQLLMLQEDNHGNPQPANELFGLKPVPFQEGIAKYLQK